MDRKQIRGLATGLLLSALFLLGYQVVTGEEKTIQEKKPGYIEVKESDWTKLQDDVNEWQTKYERLVQEKAAIKNNGNNENPKDAKKQKEKIIYKLTISKGMSSMEISELLADVGVVKDANTFNEYLEKENLQGSIQIGTFQLNNEMSEEEIAKKITKEH